MNPTDPSRDPGARALAVLSSYEPAEARSLRIRDRMRTALARTDEPVQPGAVSNTPVYAVAAEPRRWPGHMAPALVGTACVMYLIAVVSAAVRLTLIR
jgi:hypothetical protein